MATVDRVLPWRRQASAPADEVASVVAAYRTRHPKANTSTITRALAWIGRLQNRQTSGCKRRTSQ